VRWLDNASGPGVTNAFDQLQKLDKIFWIEEKRAKEHEVGVFPFLEGGWWGIVVYI
jgi:hypothetical protein